MVRCCTSRASFATTGIGVSSASRSASLQRVLGYGCRATDERAEFRSDALEFIPAGDCVVVPYKLYGKPHGGKTQVYRLRNRKIVEVCEYRTKAQALDAVGLKG